MHVLVEVIDFDASSIVLSVYDGVELHGSNLPSSPSAHLRALCVNCFLSCAYALFR